MNRLDVLTNAQFQQILFYRRYIDDILSVVPSNMKIEILDFMNAFHQSLKFTMETSVQNRIAFLDLKISVSNMGEISFNHFRKASQTTRVIPFNSYQSKATVIAGLKNEIMRVVAHTTHQEDLCSEMKYLISKYLENGFPLATILKYTAPSWYNKVKDKDKKLEHKSRVVVPYVGGVFEELAKFQYCGGFQLVGEKCKTLKTLLQGQQTTLPSASILEHKNVVYSVPCSQCDCSYIGQTRQTLKKRIQAHKSEIKHKVDNNSIFRHLKDQGHEPDFNNTEVVCHEKHYWGRLNLETLAIYLKGDKAINHLVPQNRALKLWKDIMLEHNCLDSLK